MKNWTSIIPHLHEGFLNLFSSKLRSALALLGVLVGTASVVAMVSGGELATNEAIKQFKTLGIDLLAATLNEDSSNEKKISSTQESLSLSQVNDLGKINSQIVEIAPYTQLYQSIQFNSHEINGSTLGVTDSFARVVHVEMAQGRFISILDKYAFYCVIGNNLYQEIKKYTYRNPIGQQLQMGKYILTIVGIAKPWPENNFVYANVDNAVMVPLLTSTLMGKYAVINNLIIRLQPDANLEGIKERMTEYINQHVSNKQLYFRSAKELIARMAKQSQILTVFLGLIGSISLLVGGIGVMNIMLVSVVERRREIGIRLAVGARRKDIRLLFLAEAVMLSLAGGTLGVLLGIIVAYIIAWIWNWEFILFLWPPLIGFSVSVAVGIFFGFYPAYKASQWNPIDALRSE